MKTITNILSYLWLLLLMAVTACSDLEEEVGPIQGEEEVELTIRTQVPGMKAGTRAAETENLTTITALVFNAEKELIKKVDNVVTSTTDGTQGTFTLKVPLRTRSIHFIGNPTGVNLPSVPSEGDAAVTHDALKTLTTTGSLAYWGYASFTNVAALRAYKNQTLTLYRNKAKISIEKAGTFNGSLAIAGLENVYKKGVLVPHYGDEFNFNLNTNDYQTLPTSVSNEEKGQEKYQSAVTETYVFEHPNEEGNALFAICLINQKYYKVALAKNNSGTLSYYRIIRNHQYRIKINAINESLGQDTYEAAVNSDPINNAEAEVEEDKQVALKVTASPTSTRSYDNTAYTVTVTTTEDKLTDISTLTLSGLNSDMYELTSTTGVTNSNETYTVTADQAEFTFTLKDGYIGKEVSNSITFEGDGTHVVVTPATANLNLSTFAEMYEMYFDGGNLGGSNEYDKFFHTRQGTISTGDASGLETTFYDDGANSHMDKHLLMNSNNNNSFSFTIADTRYLTLLVANDGDDNTASINLIGTLSNGSSWTTAGTTEDLTNGTYNFAAEGEITTAGRLIRYTLEPGTYTLQRGNNDYLLYYMRVSKEKPTMTDIVQPTAADYSLAWSGGEYGTYLEDPNTNNGTKYYVDDDATTFTPTLTYNGLKGVPLSTISLQVLTDNYTFTDNGENVSGTVITHTTITNQYNEINPTLQLNAGKYTLGGTIENVAETDYKYAAFYDNIQLKEVSDIEVKNTIKVGLYNSWEGNAAEIDKYAISGPYLIGFKMPQNTLPVAITEGENGTVTSINFAISSEWVREHSGLGVQSDGKGNYQLTTQSETNEGQIMRAHPRPEWTYKIEWSGIPENTKVISPSTTDTDVYFSYKGTIDKQVDISTGLDGQTFDITLDFYTENDVAFDNLVFGETNFYLKATIPNNVPAGTTIVLNKNIEGDVNAVHQYYSHYLSDGITNSWTNEMSFTTVAGKTEYLTCWKFVRSDNRNSNDVNISFTLTSTNESVYKLSGETSANITIKGNHEKQIKVSVDGGNTSVERANTSLEYTKDGNDQLTVRVTVPDGVGVLNIEADDFNVSWADADAQGKTSGDTYTFTNSTGERIQEFILTLKEESKTLKDESLINFAYAADRWTVAPGVVVVWLSEKVVTENVIFNYNFDDNKMPQINSWFNDGSKGSLSVSDKCLVINMTTSVTNSWSAQASIDVAFEEGVEYTLSFRIKANVDINKLPMYLQEPVSPNYPERGTFVSEVDISANGGFQPFNVTIEAESTYNDGRFIIDFGHIQGIIYIDDLKLVRN